MSAHSFLDWPFFTAAHRELVERLDAWAAQHLSSGNASAAAVEDQASVDAECRRLVRELGAAGWTRYSAPTASGQTASGLTANGLTANGLTASGLNSGGPSADAGAVGTPGPGAGASADLARTAVGSVHTGFSAVDPSAGPAGAGKGAAARFDVRALALIRERLAWHDGLADFAFAMQGLGSGAISIAGSEELKRHYLPQVAEGRAIAAFALSEPEAGSDVAAMRCCARRDGDGYVLDGQKTWISNGGIADFYCVFARTSGPEVRPDGTTAASGISAFVVDAHAPGLSIARRLETLAPHPLATLSFEGCRVPAAHLLGAEGEGFKLAMRTLDVFRTSVAGAALGFAQRALDESLTYSLARPMFGKNLAALQLTQAALADMATELDAARLLTYRAAWLRDQGQTATKEVAMAKMTATEAAQRVIDRAVQLFGGRGVLKGEVTERLYRDIRALRIYEGATEVQKLIIGRDLLNNVRK